MIDPAIPLQARAPEAPSPLSQLGAVQQLRNSQLQGQQAQIGIQQQQRAMQAQQALNDAMRTSITNGPDGQPVWDKGAISKSLAGAGFGDQIPGIMEHLQKVDQTASEIQKNKAQAAEANAKVTESQNDFAGYLGLGVKKLGYQPGAAVSAIAYAAAHQQIDPQTAQQLTAAIQANPSPQFVQQLVDPMIAKSPKAQESLLKEAQMGEAGARANEATVNANRTQTLLPGQLQGQQLTNTELQQKTTGNVPLTPKDKVELGLRKQEVGLRGQEVGIQGARLGIERYNAGIGPDGKPMVSANLTGDAFLQTLPAPMQNRVKAIAEGREPMPTGRAGASGPGRVLAEAVTQYDPQFSTQRAQIRSAFTTGKDGTNIGNLNTAAEHLDQYLQAFDALKNGSFRPGNALYNSISTALGRPAPTTVQGMSSVVSGEMANALKGTATDAEIKNIHEGMPTSSSPDQAKGWGVSQLNALHTKLNTYAERYAQQIPGDKTYSPVLPSAKAVFSKYGVDGQQTPAKGPALGTVEDGYQFMGGDPSDQSRWKKVGK